MKLKISYLSFCYTLSFLVLIACKESKPDAPIVAPAVQVDTLVTTFTNPLLSKGADPWVTQKDSTYYYTYTHGSKVVFYVTKTLSQVNKATIVNAWVPPPGTSYSQNIWAPELHEINGNWYVYFAADNGSNANHRMYVIENTSGSPLRGNWEFKGKVADPTNQWAIDGTILQHNGQLYMLWSGSQSGASPQNIYVAKMSNPWTIEGQRVLICTPDYNWEKYNGAINEGPQVLKNPQGKVFVIFSGSSFSSDNYCLGMLSLKDGGDPLIAADWIKTSGPIFSMKAENGAFGTGHNAFFKSPDRTEDWIIYHARSLPNGGSTNYRNPRMQKFTWNTDGTPNFGEPVNINERLNRPSGEL